MFLFWGGGGSAWCFISLVAKFDISCLTYHRLLDVLIIPGSTIQLQWVWLLPKIVQTFCIHAHTCIFLERLSITKLKRMKNQYYKSTQVLFFGSLLPGILKHVQVKTRSLFQPRQGTLLTFKGRQEERQPSVLHWSTCRHLGQQPCMGSAQASVWLPARPEKGDTQWENESARYRVKKHALSVTVAPALRALLFARGTWEN